MNNNQVHIDRLRELLPEYMSLLQEDGLMNNAYGDYWDCPFCGEEGKLHVYRDNYKTDGYKCYCYTCNKNRDIFDLVGYYENLTRFPDKYNRAVQIMKQYLDGTRTVSKSQDKSSVDDLPELLDKFKRTLDNRLAPDRFGRFIDDETPGELFFDNIRDTVKCVREWAEKMEGLLQKEAMHYAEEYDFFTEDDYKDVPVKEPTKEEIDALYYSDLCSYLDEYENNV